MMRQLTITPGYLQTARITLARGRDISSSDTRDSPRVALIDEEGARTWFPNQDPIGRQFRTLEKPGEPPRWTTIIGIVRPVIYDVLIKRRPIPAIYFAEDQTPERFLSVMIRTKSDPAKYADLARNTAARWDRHRRK